MTRSRPDKRPTGRLVSDIPLWTSHEKDNRSRTPRVPLGPHIWDLVTGTSQTRDWCYECSAEHQWGTPHLNPVRQRFADAQPEIPSPS